MRLQKIKLAGFKSFVDSTTISFPSNMVAVVGPNGCGKSNVIDAVRWVMGESSAKHLRGDLMADVVFNGSTTRKPVGQAFVELTFDNSDGSLGGEYASYQQIALKRQVGRDGLSAYFLNGTRCRKKDITDLFLGTGLGSRSYAIIEQGTISRLIEAKPAELRVFLEEAAGISKYKERRRETQNRIRRTRENLERVSDVCDELEKQCRHLKRQANTAQRFNTLKLEEREFKAQLLALRWQALDDRDTVKKFQLAELDKDNELTVVRHQALEAKLAATRSQYEQQREVWTAAQAGFYAQAAKISQAEQAINHLQQQQQKDAAELAQLKQVMANSEQLLQKNQQDLSAAEQLKQQTEQELGLLRGSEKAKQAAFVSADKSMRNWQQNWDKFIAQQAEPQRRIEVEQLRLKQRQANLNKAERVVDDLLAEQTSTQTLLANNDLADQEQALQQVVQSLQTANQQCQAYQQKTALLREEIHLGNDQLAKCQRELSSLTGQLASIKLLDAAANNQSAQLLSDQLVQQGYATKQSLLDVLEVKAGWELAVETVLANALQAVEVNNIGQLLSHLTQLPKANISLFAKGITAGQGEIAPSSIAQVVKGDMARLSLFANIHIAETLEEAWVLLKKLADDQSVICRDGIWLRHDYVLLNSATGSTGQVFARSKEKKQAVLDSAKLSLQISEREHTLSQAKKSISEAEKALQQFQQQSSQLQADVSSLTVGINSKQLKLEQAQQTLFKIAQGLAKVRQEQQSDESSMAESEQTLQNWQEKLVQRQQDRLELEKERELKRQSLEQAQSSLQLLKNELHRLQLKQESQRSSCALITHNSESMTAQLKLSADKISVLELAIAKPDQQIAGEKIALQAMLNKTQQLEDNLTQMRQAVEEFEQTIRQYETERQAADKALLNANEGLSAAKLLQQELMVRKTTLCEQLQEKGLELAPLLANLPADASTEQCQKQLKQLAEKLERLGVINLTAIDEYEEQSQRQTYLEEQQADLNGSLDLLEQAVTKIDKESRARFKQTFDKVNEGLEKRFPTLFGGGHAYLQLTTEDLLETGVTVMARPPGKRNSTIHLLSGGEKALTAVALVFAIFDLNPAPFCMLDEVDAPLDEANVGRFSDLVAQMSKQVQMILITHNKRTMEGMDQLVGVTMKEAGVSQVVAVDLNEAAAMVAS